MLKKTLIAAAMLVTLLVHAQTTTEVLPLAKAMNPAFAADYAKGQYTVMASFLAATPSDGYLWGAIPPQEMQGRVGFRISSPGEAVQSFPNVPNHAFINKADSEILFSLQPGERIAITGHPVIGIKYGLTQVIFSATSVARTSNPR